MSVKGCREARAHPSWLWVRGRIQPGKVCNLSLRQTPKGNLEWPCMFLGAVGGNPHKHTGNMQTAQKDQQVWTQPSCCVLSTASPCLPQALIPVHCHYGHKWTRIFRHKPHSFLDSFWCLTWHVWRHETDFTHWRALKWPKKQFIKEHKHLPHSEPCRERRYSGCYTQCDFLQSNRWSVVRSVSYDVRLDRVKKLVVFQSCHSAILKTFLFI